MNRYIVCLAVVVSALVAQGADSQSLPNVVALRLSISVTNQIANAFQRVRPTDDPSFSHTDIAKATLKGDSLISSLLGLSSALHDLTLRPFYPTHSIAFEEIRKRSNSPLFINAQTSSATERNLKSEEERLSRWFILQYSDSASPESVVAMMQKSQAIELVEPRFIRKALYTPNDPRLGEQFSLSVTHVFEAWDVVRCDSTILLAIDDVGTDWTHEDLRPSVVINWGETGIDSNGLDKRANGIDDDRNGLIDDWHGWDFAGTYGEAADNDTRSPDNHGTHTAGIMGATGNNVKGIAGVSFGARILPIKSAGDYSGSLDFAFQGVIYAADMHSKAVNCSFGGSSYSQAEQDAIDYAVAKGCSVVAASGNDSRFLNIYPAAYEHVLGVASAGANGSVTPYSDYNTHVSVYAPGGEAGKEILSTFPDNTYGGSYGTSMASPHACGVVGLVRKRFPWMNALQAEQQVRATSKPMPTDSGRKYYIGHGLVNALAAVKDTNAHSARIEKISIADDIGLGYFVAGERGGLVLHVHNYLQPVRDLWATLEVTEGADAVTFESPVVLFGAVDMDQTIENVQTGLRIKVNDSVSKNTRVTVRVTFFDTLVGYGPDVDYFSFVVGPSYLDLNANNLTVTFNSIGMIGYNDPVTNSQGSGFLWRSMPPNINPLAKSLLFSGGLMIGLDSQRVVDVAVQNSTDADHDFSTTEAIHAVSPDRGAAQELVCSYSDAATDDSYKVGVDVTQRTYAYTQGLAANAVVAQYVLRKGTDTQATDALSAGLFMDWDIGISGALNVTRFDSLKNIAVIYRIEPNYPYVGVAVISKVPDGSAVNYHAIRNDGSQGDINTFDGFDRQQKRHAMTEFFNQTGPGDVSMEMGLKNLPLASQDSIEMTVVYALAQSPELLDQTIDEVKSLWALPAAEVSQAKPISSITVTPNPFQTHLEVSWSVMANTTITIVDALGRTVVLRQVHSDHCDLHGLQLPAGVYHLSIEVGDKRIVKTIVSAGLF